MTPDEFMSKADQVGFPAEFLRFLAKERWAVAYEHDRWLVKVADMLDAQEKRIAELDEAYNLLLRNFNITCNDLDAAKERIVELHERLSAAESKEVCTVAHKESSLAFCQACRIEELEAQLRLANIDQVNTEAELAEARRDAERILRDGIVNAPCPTPAQWRQLQDFAKGYLAARGEP